MTEQVNIFEQASRKKLTFTTAKGPLMVQDLWDLPLQSATGKINLDDIAKELNAECKGTEISFVTAKTSTNSLNLLRFEIVVHIIGVKIEESKAAVAAKDKAELKAKIMAKIEEKKDKSLDEKSLDELLKIAEGLS